MPEEPRCPKCGQAIPRGAADCPNCGQPIGFYLRRESLLLVSFAVLALLFVITSFAVKLYHAKEQALARNWFARGERALNEGQGTAALSDFRNALFHEPASAVYQLQLTRALIATGRLAEAGNYLLRLWATDPANGPVNLELGRLAMRQGQVSQVITYFHSAIGGVWREKGPSQRQLREELSEYLIGQGQRDEAVAELMALSAQTPNSPKLRTQVASLFLKAQDYAFALKEFHASLELDSRQPAAWAGAGEAAFALGDYGTARSDLRHAVVQDPHNSAAAKMLALADQVIRIDPFDRRVPVAKRRRRAIAAFGHALARVRECAARKGESLAASNPATPLAAAYADALKIKPQVNMKAFRRNADLMDSTMRLVFQIEKLAVPACGPGGSMDQALLLLSSRAGGLS
jgi:tetratricopeptide (TPR) repeat protein